MVPAPPKLHQLHTLTRLITLAKVLPMRKANSPSSADERGKPVQITGNRPAAPLRSICNYVVICRADGTCGQRPSLCFVSVLFPSHSPSLLGAERGKGWKNLFTGTRTRSSRPWFQLAVWTGIYSLIAPRPTFRPTAPHIQRVPG